MAAVSESLKKSSISVENISKSLLSTRKTVSSVNDSVNNISKIISTNTRIKRELFSTSETIDARRREASKRREMEDQIESSKLSYSPGSAISFASKGQGGPLSRLLGFLGFTFAGWIVENLPTWIFMGKEFISRIQIFGRSMYDMVDNMRSIIQSFGSVLTNSFDAILRLDFNEFSEGSVARSFDELNLAVQGLGDDITETFRLFTTPLNESVETGEQAPGLEEERPETMFPPISQPGERKVTGIHRQALDIIAGPESGGNYNAMNQGTDAQGRILGSGDSKKIIGKALTDMTIGEVIDRQNQSKYPRNASPDRGIHAAGKYQIIGITLPGAMRGAGLKPSDKFSPENQDLLGLAVLKSQGIGAWTSGGSRYSAKETAIIKEAQRTDVKFLTSPTSQPSSPAQVQPAPMIVTSGFGWRWGRQHQGIDLAPKTGKVEGTPVIIKKGGTVVYANIGSGNMGQILITHDDGTQSRYLHVNNFRVKEGQKVNAGQTIASLAAMGASGIGNATGPHLHFEYYSSTSAPPSDPAGVYQNYVSLGGKVINVPPNPLDPNQQPRIAEPAQISALPKAGQPAAAMTPERKGSEVMFIDATQPQAPQVSYPAQQAGPQIQVDQSKMLNNFIKKKLLLDLAYT